MVKKSDIKEECFGCRYLYGFVLSPRCRMKENPQEKEIKCKKRTPFIKEKNDGEQHSDEVDNGQ